MDFQPSELTYFISERNTIAIVCFRGTMVRANATTFEKAVRELTAKAFKTLVLNFSDVPLFDRTLVPALALLQKTLRQKGTQIRLASLHPDIQAFLDSQGLLRRDEIAKDLTHALQSITGQKRSEPT